MAPERVPATCPQRPRTALFIFDWDDTLFPTTFALSETKLRLGLAVARRPENWPPKEQREPLRALQKAVQHVLRVARELGTVAVVTLAEEGWVRHGIQCLMPGVGRTLQELGIQVVSARAFGPKAAEMPEANASGSLPANAPEEDIQDLIDWKAAAMASFVNLPDHFPLDVYSIGDSEIEAHAARDLVQRRVSKGTKSTFKLLKLQDEPTIETLTAQLCIACLWLRKAARIGHSSVVEICNPVSLSIAASPPQTVSHHQVGHSSPSNEQTKNERPTVAVGAFLLHPPSPLVHSIAECVNESGDSASQTDRRPSAGAGAKIAQASPVQHRVQAGQAALQSPQPKRLPPLSANPEARIPVHMGSIDRSINAGSVNHKGSLQGRRMNPRHLPALLKSPAHAPA